MQPSWNSLTLRNLQAELSPSSHIYILPAGSTLPEGIDVFTDEGLTNPLGNINPPGHNTIYPSTNTTLGSLQQKIGGLNWQYLGKLSAISQ